MGLTELGLIGALLFILFGGKKITAKKNTQKLSKTKHSSIKPRAKAHYQDLEVEYPEPKNTETPEV